MIARPDISACVLAGGQGSRMGGVDKGLMPFIGVPLAHHAALCIAPQVGQVFINANRNLDIYRHWGWPVVPDDAQMPAFAGPLAGILAALRFAQTQAKTPYLAILPCDAPLFPNDWVARLGQDLLLNKADIAVACSPTLADWQPTFCLLRADPQWGLAASLEGYLNSGQRQLRGWLRLHPIACSVFPDAWAFTNANTPDELAAMARKN